MKRFLAFVFAFTLQSVLATAWATSSNTHNPLSRSPTGAPPPVNPINDFPEQSRDVPIKICIAALTGFAFLPVMAVVPFVAYFMNHQKKQVGWVCDPCEPFHAETCFINATRATVFKTDDSPQPYHICHPIKITDDLDLDKYVNPTDVTACRQVTIADTHWQKTFEIGLISFAPAFFVTALTTLRVLWNLEFKDWIYFEKHEKKSSY